MLVSSPDGFGVIAECRTQLVGQTWLSACSHTHSFSGAQPCLPVYGSSVAAFLLQQQG